MPNNFIDYAYFYKYRPNEKDLKRENGNIYLKGHFPKTIKKGTYILSEYPYVSHKVVIEYYILYKILHKPIAVCATSGHWDGDPFLLRAEEDITITKQDEKIIQDNMRKNYYAE